jgi:hypothetical protein
MFRIYSLAFGLSLSLHLFAGDNPPLGARSAGMAGCGVALHNDLWGVQNNPATLAFKEKIQVGIFHENRFLIPGFGSNALALAMPAKPGVFYLSIHSLSLQNLYLANKLALGLAKSFGTKISASVQLDWVYTRLGNNYGAASTATAELGIYVEPIKNLSLGFHLFNPTSSQVSKSREQRLPTVARLGGTYTFSQKLFLSLEVEKDILYKSAVRSGIEYHPVELFFIRIGAASNPGLTSFGFGLQLKQLRLDIASSFHQQLGFSPSIGLIWGL